MPVNPSYFGLSGFVFPVVLACDYPAVGDVKLGVSYGSGVYVGTYALPSLGSNPGTVNLLATLRAIVAQIPDRVDVNYYPRSTGDTFGAAVEFDARRSPATKGEYDGMARTFATWHLYALEGQVVKPARKGKIVHGADTWHVLSVLRSYGDLKFDCECVLALS